MTFCDGLRLGEIRVWILMVPPNTVSIPFKLMLFILLDGWTKVVHGLILSYA